MARAVMAVDSNQDLTLILPTLGYVLEDLSAVADGLTPYCGDYADRRRRRHSARRPLRTRPPLTHPRRAAPRRRHTPRPADRASPPNHTRERIHNGRP
jgi:hypothetical protein